MGSDLALKISVLFFLSRIQKDAEKDRFFRGPGSVKVLRRLLSTLPKFLARPTQ